MRWIFLVIAIGCASARADVANPLLNLQSPIAGNQMQISTSFAVNVLTLALQRGLNSAALRTLNLTQQEAQTVLTALLPLASSTLNSDQIGSITYAIRTSIDFAEANGAVFSQPAFVALGEHGGATQDTIELVRDFLAVWVVYHLIDPGPNPPDISPLALALAQLHASFVRLSSAQQELIPKLQYQLVDSLTHSPRDQALWNSIVGRMLEGNQVELRRFLDQNARRRYSLLHAFWTGTGAIVSGLVVGLAGVGGFTYVIGEPNSTIRTSALVGLLAAGALGSALGYRQSLRSTAPQRAAIIDHGVQLATDCRVLLETFHTPPQGQP